MTDTNGKQARLTRMQAYDLINWLKKHKDIVLNTPDHQLANDATEALGFPVTSSQVQITRTDLGLRKNATWRKDPQADANREAIRELATMIMEIVGRLQTGAPGDLDDVFRAAYELQQRCS